MEVAKIENKGNSKNLDVLGIGLDILIPMVLDNILFRGTKGRTLKLFGTVIAQQSIKYLAKSKTFDSLLDTIEEWVKPEGSTKFVESYPSAEQAMSGNQGRRKAKSKPEDYADPEREMYL